jgi:hypothetical protein
MMNPIDAAFSILKDKPKPKMRPDLDNPFYEHPWDPTTGFPLALHAMSPEQITAHLDELDRVKAIGQPPPPEPCNWPGCKELATDNPLARFRGDPLFSSAQFCEDHWKEWYDTEAPPSAFVPPHEMFRDDPRDAWWYDKEEEEEGNSN